MRTLAALIALVALIAGVFLYASRSEDTAPPVGEIEQETDRSEASFTWSYDSFTSDEIPYSRIHLTAEYADGSTETKEIDTIAGGCNDYEEADADVYAGSRMIICYYAGLGHYYKVVEAGEGYQVLRRVFEEASPEYDPPVEPFEVVAQF